MINKRKTGDNYETLACAYITAQGGCILQRNFRIRSGEIDIIARDGRYLVFAEVKYRSGERFGSAEDALTLSKQRVICKCADYYRLINHMDEFTPVRFDVLAVSPDEDGMLQVKWIRDAFSYRR